MFVDLSVSRRLIGREIYPRNAIQVKNIGQTQVGHIPRDVASKLAPLLDRKMITVEGSMREGNRTSCPSLVNVWG